MTKLRQLHSKYFGIPEALLFKSLNKYTKIYKNVYMNLCFDKTYV